MIYLAFLRLPKDEFVVAISQMFLTASVGLALGLIIFGISQPSELAVSAAACVPVLIGMWLGSKEARVRMSERAFAIAVQTRVYVGGGELYREGHLALK